MTAVPLLRTPAFLIAALAATVGLLAGLGHEFRRAAALGRGPTSAGGRTERCVACHVGPEEDPSGPEGPPWLALGARHGGAHARAALGCSSCHLGNPLAFDKERAHAGLELEPGALSTVTRTCGRRGCHAREAARVATSAMARNEGIVAVDRFAFGEIPAPDGHESMADVLSAARPTPAQDHLRRLCAGCHLGTRRANRDDAIDGNGSGCAACHVPRRRGLPSRRPVLQGVWRAERPHPPVDSKVTDDRCLGCHSRSGRIALTYQGLFEVERHPLGGGPDAPCASPVALHDGRPACRASADVHQEAGMACVDCHLHTELMGDGTARAHKEEQVEVRCETCHVRPTPEAASSSAEATWGAVSDPISRDLLRQRGESRPAGERVRLGVRGTPLWNLRPSAAGWTLFRKLDGRPLLARPTPADPDHSRRGHERLSCSACHAAWAPTCTTCHTAFDPTRRQWSFASAREEPGAWVESSRGFGAAPPSLGVLGGSVVPIVPGMLLTVDATKAGGTNASRHLYAPLEPHATGRRARTCESCHRADALPEGFTGTRASLRPFDPEERKRVLRPLVSAPPPPPETRRLARHDLFHEPRVTY